jgi:hypothetical protein
VVAAERPFAVTVEDGRATCARRSLIAAAAPASTRRHKRCAALDGGPLPDLWAITAAPAAAQHGVPGGGAYGVRSCLVEQMHLARVQNRHTAVRAAHAQRAGRGDTGAGPRPLVPAHGAVAQRVASA